MEKEFFRFKAQNEALGATAREKLDPMLLQSTENYVQHMEAKIGLLDTNSATTDDVVSLHDEAHAEIESAFLQQSGLDPNSKIGREYVDKLERELGGKLLNMQQVFEKAKTDGVKIYQELLNSSLQGYNKSVQQILDSDDYFSADDFSAAVSSIGSVAMGEFERQIQHLKDEERAAFAERLRQEFSILEPNLQEKNRVKIELMKSRAVVIVSELQKEYQEKLKKACSTGAVKTEEEFKELHNTSKVEAVDTLQRKCGPEIGGQYETGLKTDVDDSFDQQLEYFKVKREELKSRMQNALRDVKLVYKDEMEKHYRNNEFVEPDVLQAFHDAVSSRLVRTCQPALPEPLEKELLEDMEKLFIGYKEQNELNTPATDLAIGIDLGTTYSCVAVYLNGAVQIISNSQGNNITPSYVAFRDTAILVGEGAKDQAPINPENTIFDAKRLIGRKFEDPVVQQDMALWPFAVVEENGVPKVDIKGTTYFPEQISAEVLKEMKKCAESYLGGRDVKNAVITVPAYFNDGQRQATIDAGELAGLKVLSIINEPTSAAMAYRIQHATDFFTPRRALIFDLGGGTFDVALLKISSGEIDVQEIGGDTHLGGEDFDGNIVNYCMDQFLADTGVDLRQGKNSANLHERQAANKAMRRLRNECEKKKKALSSTTEVEISIDAIHGSEDLSVVLTRDKFEELNQTLFEKTLEEVDKVLSHAGVTTAQIEDIVLVGGSTRIPKIQKMLSDHFGGKQLNKTVNPDEAVAYGAAMQAAILNGKIAQKDGNYVKLKDVTPYSLGIEVYGGGFSIILPKSSSIPTSKQEVYKTAHNNQTSVQIVVYEGEEAVAKNNNKLGEFYLNGVPPGPAGHEDINVTLGINDQGILHVMAVSGSTGKASDLTITEHKQRLSRDMIQRILSDGK